MFERILAPLDGSSLAECVLPHLVALAKVYHSEVFLLQMLDPLGAITRPRPIDPLDWTIHKAEAEAYLKGIASKMQDAGVSASMDVREGRAAEGVIECARANNAGLIVMSSHGQSGISGWNVSSVVQKIIVRAQTSVMIVRAYQPAPQKLDEYRYRRIFLPLDGSLRAEAVLPTARELARAYDAELLVAHVVERPNMPRRTPLSEEDNRLLNQVIERNQMEASRYLAEVEARLDGKIKTRLIVHDSPDAALHELADQSDVDLVMLSAHGNTGGTKWPYGSMVISFITYGATPLLIIQDLPPEQMEPTRAELAAREHGGR